MLTKKFLNCHTLSAECGIDYVVEKINNEHGVYTKAAWALYMSGVSKSVFRWVLLHYGVFSWAVAFGVSSNNI